MLSCSVQSRQIVCRIKNSCSCIEKRCYDARLGAYNVGVDVDCLCVGEWCSNDMTDDVFRCCAY